MEQAKYLMWSTSTRSSDQRSLISSPVHHPIFASSSSSCTESWEERAFAVDSAGNFLGGCTWPPTSYTCSFCRREFRSAQALGGHMNVHRRDRAMLKQSSSSEAEESKINDPSHNPSDLLMMNLRANPNYCNSNYCNSLNMIPSILYKAPADHQAISSSNSFYSTAARQNHFEANSTEGKQNNISILQLKHGRESLKMGDLDYYDLASRNYICHDGEEYVGRKRRREDGSVLPLTSSNLQADQVETEVHKFSPNPVEELDLELRLGCYSKLQKISCKDIVLVE